MRWATRRGVHIDRAATAWLVRRFVDPDAEFVFVGGLGEVREGVTPFDMRGVELGHQDHDGVQECTFETVLRRYDLDDPVLWKLAEAVHEADLEDDRFDSPDAAGLDAVLRGLSLTLDDDAVLAVTGPVFDGLYEYYRRAVLLGRPPA
jgi:hypothetical protein